MPDPQIGPLDPQTRTVPNQPEDPFASPDLMHALLRSVIDPSNIGGGPSQAVTTLGKGEILNNLLNHIEDLKGTIYEPAINAIADKAPHVLGHIEKIALHPRNIPDVDSGVAGSFWADDEKIGKGLPLGNIDLLETLKKRFMDAPEFVLGHEMGHAAQQAIKGKNLWNLYSANRDAYEQAADKTAANIAALVAKGKK